MEIIGVALDVPVDGLFDYQAEGAGLIGTRVQVPFGKKKLVGLVMSEGVESTLDESKIRTAAPFSDIPPLPRELLDLFRFCSRYYQHPLGEVAMNSLPPLLKSGKNFSLPKFFRLSEGEINLPARSKKMQQLLDALANPRSIDEIRKISPGASSALKKMLAQGLIEECPPPAAEFFATPGPELKEEQKAAVEKITQSAASFKTWLLYGITGSGKSEVYLRLAEAVLAKGQQLLLLVPEISLTPQLEARVRSRFPQALVAALHSGLGAKERLMNWLLAQSGRASIVLGTRLAVFAPMPKLGMIVVDEEHDPSFKQQEGLRYSARDVAIFRAKELGIPIVLGSATPSLESLHNARQGRYGLLRLASRAVENATLPAIDFVDTRAQKCEEGLSAPLVAALKKTLSRREQSLVFVNRRGYAPVLYCQSCTWTARCHRCSSRLVLHAKERKLRCHYCGLIEALPRACPDCGNLDLQPLGHGTQRIEQRLAELFPEARILRIDRDSTRRKDSWGEMLEKIRAREVDILVGTQMIAKGHDFPNLTLVGIIDSDSAFYSSDFRATERLFSQLCQVSGRAGRADLPGEVLIQTELPSHPLYQALKGHDFDAIAEILLAERKAAGFPPYIHQALLRSEAEKLETALAFLSRARAAAEGKPDVIVFEPASAAMMRISNLERAQLLIQSASRKSLQQFLANWREKLKKIPARGVRWHLDVDPLEF